MEKELKQKQGINYVREDGILRIGVKLVCTGSVKHCTGTEWNLVGTDTFHRFKGNYFLFCVPVYLRT